MRYYPVFLDLRGRRCVVVGGGRVAERKVRTLLRAGANVRLISPLLTARLEKLYASGRIRVSRRRYRKGDLVAGVGAQGSPRRLPLLVYAATDDPGIQQAVRKDAEAAGALVNLADDREDSTFLVPASFAQGDLLVAISTSGASPALAHLLRRRLQATLGREYKGYVEMLRQTRSQVLSSIPTQKRRARVFRRLVGRLGKIKNQEAKIKRQKLKSKGNRTRWLRNAQTAAPERAGKGILRGGVVHF